jgi:type III restriction enzyme
MFALKRYQQRTLDVLKSFLERARFDGPESAFATTLAESGIGSPRRYRAIDGLEAAPYVCLRLPTGGGKTVLAAHSVAVAAKAYLEADFPVVLWLVPTNTIRLQTREALGNPTHPYRRILDDTFDGKVSVFDIGDVTQIRPQELSGRVCIIVGTLATLRVTSTDGRKIYAHNEALEPHFSRVSPNAPGLERIEEGAGRGTIKFSFANLLHLHRPLVIMDEAHNARTRLTFESLARVSPACIVEFTATPAADSNVLHRVSAGELKSEEMIKLPIVLTEHGNWQEAVRDAVLTRARLAQEAADSGDRIRPIVLFQAENKDREVTVEVLRNHLIENEKIDASRIALATGAQRELDGVDLFAPDCPIEFIITVEALKEGWDCSFAYVFCTLANIKSAVDVEQLLGRVLRMPFACRRKAEPLNRAYAHVASPSFAAAALQLRDRLVAMGFEEEEAEDALQAGHPPSAYDLPLFSGIPLEPPLRLILKEVPDLSAFTPEEQSRISVTEAGGGTVSVIVTGEIAQAVEEKLIAAVAPEVREEVRIEIQSHRRRQRPLAPSERGEQLRIPRLCLWVQGELEPAEKELFLDIRGWSPLDFPAILSESEFSIRDSAETFEVDVQGKQVVYRHVDGSRQLDLNGVPTEWTPADLVRWLDREIRQPDIRQEVLLEFLRRVVTDLTDRRKIPLAVLVRAKYPLSKTLAEKLRVLRQQAYDRGYQATLFGAAAAVETSDRYVFEFPPDNYPAQWYYRGAWQPSKHFYPHVGELETKGEEFECARALDALPEVKCWARNLAKQPACSFWLPTATDRFYPDFVAELVDGRLFVIEYKGAPYVTNDDSKEKRMLGDLWAGKSGGRALFLMAEKKDAAGRGVLEQLREAIRANALHAT